MSQEPRVPIDERGNKLFPTGTVYYSRNAHGFLAAGRQDEGVLPLSGVSGRVKYSLSKSGVMRFRDETGVFIPTGFALNRARTNFGTGRINVQDERFEGDPRGVRPPGDSQFVERQTILMPDGTVKVIEVNHGIGQRFDDTKQGKQWWRKMKEALGDEGKKKTSTQMHAMIVQDEILIRTNLGPVAQGG